MKKQTRKKPVRKVQKVEVHSLFTDYDIHLFREGKHFNLYERLGSHVIERDEIVGFNAIGLRRRGFSRPAIAELKQAFHTVYFTPGNIRVIAAEALTDGTFATPEAKRFLEFFSEGKRSFARARRAGMEEAEG